MEYLISDQVFHVLGQEESSSSEENRQEGLPIGEAVRNGTSPIPHRLSYIILVIYHLFRKLSCIAVHRDNNTTPAIYVMHRSITTAARMTSPAAIEASHLRNAWTTVGQLEPHFRGQGAKMSIGYKRKQVAHHQVGLGKTRAA